MQLKFQTTKNKAFTLVELVTAISILVVIMVAVSAFQYNVISYNRSSAVALTNATEAQSILKVIARELREMSPSSNGAYPIAVAATSTVTFFADIDGDGVKEQIRYFIASSTVKRGIIKPTGSPLVYSAGSESFKILATGIRNSSSTPLFEYFPGTYTGTSTALSYPLNISTIRLIRVSMTIDSDPNKAPILRSFNTQVVLRNIKDNL
jgi:prepilin-type N-terminal cleavage/methylation domain-containing protein